MGNLKIVTAKDLKKCLTCPSKKIETGVGVIEYAEMGDGPAILSVHGGPGGYDQGLGIGEVFRKGGFRIISVSRPGYLGTPLETGKTAEAQGDALAAFLDAMGISKVIVVGCSAGGPPSYQLAERHPDKVSALIEIDSASMKYVKAQELSKIQETVYLSRPGLWLMDYFMRHFPKSVVKNLLKTESSLDKHELKERIKEIADDENKLAFINFLFKTMSQDYKKRKAGVANDLAILDGIDKLPLSNISCHTLIIHGDADSDVPISHGEYAHKEIKDSDFYKIRGSSHIGFWVSEKAYEAQEYAINWLRKVVN